MVTLTEAFLNDILKLQQSDLLRTVEALSKLSADSRISSLRTRKMNGVPFWEIRASQELRIIATHSSDHFICQIVDHHDVAFRRAERIQPASPSAASPLEKLNERPVTSAAGLSDNQLTKLFGIPDEWLAAVRSFADADAVANSGIDEVIGLDNALKLMQFLEGAGTPPAPSAALLSGNLVRLALQQNVNWEKIDQFVYIAPKIYSWNDHPTFGYFLEKLRSHRTRGLFITRPPVDEDHTVALQKISALKRCEVLVNESLHACIIAAIGPNPDSFAILAPPATDLSQITTGTFFASSAGYESIIKSLANVGVNELRSSLGTSSYAA